MKKDRKKILLRAAYDILKKCDDTPYVVSPIETIVYYDKAECDGAQLMEDIANELGLPEDAEPLCERAKSYSH